GEITEAAKSAVWLLGPRAVQKVLPSAGIQIRIVSVYRAIPGPTHHAIPGRVKVKAGGGSGSKWVTPGALQVRYFVRTVDCDAVENAVADAEIRAGLGINGTGEVQAAAGGEVAEIGPVVCGDIVLPEGARVGFNFEDSAGGGIIRSQGNTAVLGGIGMPSRVGFRPITGAGVPDPDEISEIAAGRQTSAPDKIAIEFGQILQAVVGVAC